MKDDQRSKEGIASSTFLTPASCKLMNIIQSTML